MSSSISGDRSYSELRTNIAYAAKIKTYEWVQDGKGEGNFTVFYLLQGLSSHVLLFFKLPYIGGQTLEIYD